MKMSGALSLHFTRSTPMIAVGNGGFNHGPPVNFPCNSNRRLSTSMSMGQYRSSDSSVLTSTVGFTPSSSVQLSQGSFNCRHIQVLSFAACAAAISATWLFWSVIPTLLAFKRAAESLEKLMDVTREELPNTMAAIRLSGMEISDLTMELSDLGQEITQGVRKSTHVVRVAEERLRKLTNTNPSGPMQEKVAVNGAKEPVVARTVRGIRQGIVKGRGISQTIFTFGRFSKIAINYLRTRAKANA